MVVLCALVRAAGLPSAAPLLSQRGLRSPAWRTREGTLRLVIAGLLSCRPSSSSAGSGTMAAEGRRKYSISNERQSLRAKGGSGVCGRGHGSTVETAMDAEEILRDVGSLLKDERPEVRVNNSWNWPSGAQWGIAVVSTTPRCVYCAIFLVPA